MYTQQVADYIKKAKAAGIADEQIKSALLKNGWNEMEISENFQAVLQAARPAAEAAIPGVNEKPEKKRRGIGGLLISLAVILILLSVAGAGVWYFITLTKTTVNPVIENEVKNEEPAPSLTLATAKLATILQDYDASKITVAAFNDSGDKVAYCVQQKVGNKISCFLNDEILSNSYNYKPYWIGISPDGNRVAFLYLDPIKKQSFVFEDGKEGTRYDGTITSPKFSDDSQSFMYIVMGKDNKSFVVLDDKPSAPHDRIYSIPAFSSDGKYILYGVRDGQDLFWVADEINLTNENK